MEVDQPGVTALKRDLEQDEASGLPLAKKLKPQETQTPEEAAPSANPDNENQAPPAGNAATDDLPGKIRRQIEYYLSDKNLAFDKFFHETIKQNPEGWLSLDCILSCKKIQQLNATKADVVSALQNSDSVESSEELGVRRTNNKPLPELKDRTAGDARRNKKPGRVDDVHLAGCIVRVNDVPEEASWQTVRNAVAEKLAPFFPEATGSKQDDSDKKKPSSPVNFASLSTVGGQSVCYALLAPFTNDKNLLAAGELGTIELNGRTLAVNLVTDADEALKFTNSMPPMIKKGRTKEIQKRRREVASKPITVGGCDFDNIDYLRDCLKGVLECTPVGKVVNSKTSTVLRELLSYHPNGKAKLDKTVDFKVDLVSHGSEKSERTTRCFFVVREDGSTEDFSTQKCIIAMSANPPFKAAVLGEPPADQSTTTTTTSGENLQEVAT